MILHISVVSLITPPFTFLILLSPLPFFLMALAKSLSYCLASQKESTFSYIDLCCCFPFPGSFIPDVIFFISFFLLSLDFCFFFFFLLAFVALDVKLGCLFKISCVLR